MIFWIHQWQLFLEERRKGREDREDLLFLLYGLLVLFSPVIVVVAVGFFVVQFF